MVHNHNGLLGNMHDFYGFRQKVRDRTGFIKSKKMANNVWNSWSGLMAARWWLGFWEAGLFPGVNYYLSCWYKREEFGIRAAIFFSAAAVSGSFGGLLAAAIEKMD